MSMLRCTSGKTRNNLGVAPIEDKIKENRLRWFSYIHRRPEQAVVRRKNGV